MKHIAFICGRAQDARQYAENLRKAQVPAGIRSFGSCEEFLSATKQDSYVFDLVISTGMLSFERSGPALMDHVRDGKVKSIPQNLPFIFFVDEADQRSVEAQCRNAPVIRQDEADTLVDVVTEHL